MRATQDALPAWRHLPGINERPAETRFDNIKSAALPVTEDATAARNPAWRYGLLLLNAGYYWEAHEVLERVWLNAPPNSREQRLVQAVIHVANGALKREMGRSNAARRLAALGRSRFLDAFGSRSGRLMGLDREDALRAADAIADGAVAFDLECD